MDKEFFGGSKGVHVKGKLGKAAGIPINSPNLPHNGALGKPWKILNKHANKKKGEKLRRIYSDLDQH